MNLCNTKASLSPALSCWERAVCSEPCVHRQAPMHEWFSLRNGELGTLSYRSREGAFASVAAASCCGCFWGHWGAVGRSLGGSGTDMGNAFPTWQSPLAGFANGRRLYVWEIAFRVSQEPDFAVEALLEGWLLLDSIKENLCIHGFWLDSSVVNPDLPFRNWLIYERKLYLSSPSMKRTASECIVCQWSLVVIPVMKMVVTIPEREFFSVCFPARNNSPDQQLLSLRRSDKMQSAH